MIDGIKHKGLRLLYEKNDRSKLPADSWERIKTILSALDAADSLDDMRQPSFRLHGLAGEYEGFWSVTVRANWRIIFRFEGNNAFDLDYIDYH